ncbi:hypothetical protein AVEN_261029-1 [Araneus ventricosus]|uniref:Uncharacterized protein n=1 Tax=Araneus ventricosus TaxID=182803 RepID=A0A4Y2UDH8_ARAVE|nr:hypothetical protein AVEN_261029-1 [Araneus ventricosus]
MDQLPPTPPILLSTLTWTKRIHHLPDVPLYDADEIARSVLSSQGMDRANFENIRGKIRTILYTQHRHNLDQFDDLRLTLTDRAVDTDVCFSAIRPGRRQ